ncbi:6-phosphogluconolactonase, eukaryotic type [hydrothermal vent metagenome]|uniref:6-phosphogluconolactonase, eukaryotic type n=1 Tax=hydrothermal vent metagenome TaxID=652676 RepID=A0A3B1A0L3_9ZZZZ
MDKIVSTNSEQVITHVGNSIVALAKQCITNNDKFTIALSGGSTPKLLYQYLINEQQFKTIDLSKIFVYFSDERYVPLDDERSNYKLATDNLLKLLDIPENNIFPVDTSLENKTDSALNYQNTIKKNITRNDHDIPEFDLIILGMGTDGHTASIFPKSELVLASDILVGSCFHQESGTDRISFTFPLINAAKNIFIITVGIEKYNIIRDIKKSTKANAKLYPIQYVNPQGNLRWFSDTTAEYGV